MPIYPRNSTVVGYSEGRKVSIRQKSGNVYKGPSPLPPMPYSVKLSYFTGLENASADTGKPRRGVDELHTYGDRYQFNTLDAAAYKKAYDRFYEAVGDQAEMGLLAAERREALGLMALRALTMVKAYRALRKGRFSDFIKALDTRPVPRHRRTKWTRPKDASALWLEYWFGWSPLVADIGNVVDVLQGDVPYGQRLRGRGSAKTKLKKTLAGIPPSIVEQDARSRCQIIGKVTVTNHDLYLANKLGFVNPALIAWELVPFSFLIDWFYPVGDFLASMTNNVGIEVTDIWISKTQVIRCVEDVVRNTGTARYKATYVTSSRARASTLARPKLVLNVPNRLSLTRAATAISLLVSIFTKG